MMVMVSPYSPILRLLMAILAWPQNLHTVRWVGLALPQVLSSHHQNSWNAEVHLVRGVGSSASALLCLLLGGGLPLTL